MTWLGLKLGRHSVQAAAWSEARGRPEEAPLAGLKPAGASWEPVLARHILDGRVTWDEAAWQRLPDFALAPGPLLDILAGGAPPSGWRIDAAELLLPLWQALAALPADPPRRLCIATSVPVTDRLTSALAAALPDRLGIVLDGVWDLAPCALAARLSQVPDELTGPVLHLHLGGAGARVELWEVQPDASETALSRLAGADAPDAALHAILAGLYERIVGEWGFLWVDDSGGREDEIAAKIRRHVLHRLAAGRQAWSTGWSYELPMEYRLFAQWRHTGAARLPEAGVEEALAAAREALDAAIASVLTAGGVDRDELVEVLATGAGSGDLYLGPRLSGEWGSRLTRGRSLPALGATAVAYRNSPEGGRPIVLRAGSNIGVELPEGGFDVLMPESGDAWGEVVRVYDVPTGTAALTLRRGLRRAREGTPPVAVLPVPEGAAGPAGAVLRVWSEQGTWWGSVSPKGGSRGGEAVRLEVMA